MARMRLDFKQKLALHSWLVGNLDSLNAEKASYGLAAHRASKALGFNLSDKTLESVCRQTGVVWEHARANNMKPYLAKLTELEARIAAIEKELS